MHGSVLSNFLTQLHLISDTDVFEIDRLSLISCQSLGKAALGSTMYAFSTPSAFTFLMTAPIFLISLGSSMTATKFLHLYGLIASARCRTDLFCFCSSTRSSAILL